MQEVCSDAEGIVEVLSKSFVAYEARTWQVGL
jgi:hypothetical protein